MRTPALLLVVLLPCGLSAQEGHVGILGGRTAVELSRDRNDFGSVVGLAYRIHPGGEG